jgi:sugar phosphate permease
MGSTIGGALFPLIVKAVLDGGNWRDAVAILALIGGTLMLLPVIAFIRNKPADLGLQPDGDDAPAEEAPHDPTATGPTLREAVKHPAFYLLLVATGGLWFTATGILQHQSIYIGRELGVETGTIALIVSLFFWGAIAGKLIFGWLSDHVEKTLLMLATTLLLTIGLLILRFASADSALMLYSYALVFGIGFSGTFTMIQIVVAEFFAGRSYGRILGIFTMVDVGAGGIGINAVGRMEVAAGTYTTVLEGLAALCVLIAGIIVVLYRMRPRETETVTEAAYG